MRNRFNNEVIPNHILPFKFYQHKVLQPGVYGGAVRKRHDSHYVF